MAITKTPEAIQPAFNELVFEDSAPWMPFVVAGVAPSPTDSLSLERVSQNNVRRFDVSAFVRTLFTDDRIPIPATGDELPAWAFDEMRLKAKYAVGDGFIMGAPLLALNAVRQIGESLDLYATGDSPILTKHERKDGKVIMPAYEGFPVGVTVMVKEAYELPSLKMTLKPWSGLTAGFNLTGTGVIDWGDGTVESYAAGTIWHKYAQGGSVQVTISADTPTGVTTVYYYDEEDENEYMTPVQSIDRWGAYITAYNFAECNELTSIPNAPMRPGVRAISFPHTALSSIPASLFDGNRENFTSLAYAFASTGIKHVPAGLCRDMVNVTTIANMFNGAPVETIGTGAFDNMPVCTTATQLFFGGRFTSLPGGLFNGMPNLANVQFAFHNCIALTAVPEDIFSSNPELTIAHGVFSRCTGLTSIPGGLFRNNTKVTTFQYAFQYCAFSSIPLGLFDNNKAVTNFNFCFDRSLAPLLTGATPSTDGVRLWERAGKEGYPATVSGTQCFRGNTTLTDYAQIPQGWR